MGSFHNKINNIWIVIYFQCDISKLDGKEFLLKGSMTITKEHDEKVTSYITTGIGILYLNSITPVDR